MPALSKAQDEAFPRILVVDDDPIVLEALARGLSRQFLIAVHSDPNSALDWLRRASAVDLIVSDFRMPTMDGISFLKAASQSFPSAARVLLSGHVDLHLAMTAVNEAGVSRILEKPYPAQKLAKALRETLGLSPTTAATPPVRGLPTSIDETSIDLALRHGEFKVVYQPQLAVSGTPRFAFEALLRWETGTGAAIPPSHFIPIAEQSTAIDRLTRFVLDEACATCLLLRRSAGVPVAVSVNVSPATLGRGLFHETLADALDRHGLPPDAIEIEVTEGMAVQMTAIMRRSLAALTTAGTSIAIDDFGTGHANLDGIHRLPARALKIDRAFVRRLPESRTDLAIVTTIVALARAAGLRTVAEGVETPHQARFLESVGCDSLQGYHVGEPMNAEAARDWLSRQIFRSGSIPTTALDA